MSFENSADGPGLTNDLGTTRSRITATHLAVLAGVLAVLVSLPSLRGGFLTGDDYHLVRDHVLVNHPSFEHAFQLLTIVHRDLYQPLPLISYSLDFAVLNALDLDPVADGPRAGAWVFHLSNVLVHAINAVLVCFVLRRLTGNVWLAGGVACLFAVHPFSAEPVGWLNGRFMMMSMMFTLATLILMDRYEHSRRYLTAFGVILTTVLAHMCKISVALPVLALIFPAYRKRWPSRSYWVLWGVVSAVTGGFTLYNLYTSQEMFERAESVMAGPPVLYVLLALAQYFRQFLVPIGLSPWYPPPADLGWGEPRVISAAVTVLLVVVLAVVMFRRTRVGVLGLVWFFAAVAPTLPFVPARRSLAADRYVYLPAIGLAWIALFGVVWLHGYLKRRDLKGWGGSISFAVPVGYAFAIAGFGAVTVRTLSYYESNLASAERIVQCFPDEPGVYEAVAWAYYRDGLYADAIEVAGEDLTRHPDEMACKVWQVVGMSQFRLGRLDEAVQSLEKAISADPAYGKCYSRLGQIYAGRGDLGKAIEHYVKSVEIMPYYNPSWIALGKLYGMAGLPDAAYRAWMQTLENNAYDPNAHLAIAEIDIGKGRYGEAIVRLEKLLGWMPENGVAHANLGLAYDRSGDSPAAMREYTLAIELDPGNLIAVINRANLRYRTGDVEAARREFEAALRSHPAEIGLLVAYHDFAMSLDRLELAVAAFERAYGLVPDDNRIRIWCAYSLIQSGRVELARERLHGGPVAQVLDREVSGIHSITRVLISLARSNHDTAVRALGMYLAEGSYPDAGAVGRLIGDLQRYAVAHPEDPWAYLLTARILTAQNRPDLARHAMREFSRICADEDCGAYVVDSAAGRP